MKALVVGAGNIGMGFLGYELRRADWEVVFIETNKEKVKLINDHRRYPVYVVSLSGIKMNEVKGVSAVWLHDFKEVISEIVSSDLILTAIGKDALFVFAPYLAQGLMERLKLRPQDQMHLAVVACENAKDNTKILKTATLNQTPENERVKISDIFSFPKCLVDRIVPNAQPEFKKDSPLGVAVEDYFQFVIDHYGLKEKFPAIPGVIISKNLDAELMRKLLTVNYLHAFISYAGWLVKLRFVHEAFQHKKIISLLKGAISEINAAIPLELPTITLNNQIEFSNKTIRRFQNPWLKDEVTRVGRQPIRKLGSDDRFISVANAIKRHGAIPAFAATGIAAALHFDFMGDEQAKKLVIDVRQKGIKRVLQEVSGLSPDNELTSLIEADFLFRGL